MSRRLMCVGSNPYFLEFLDSFQSGPSIFLQDRPGHSRAK
jgi:hypothetical protein